MLGRRKWAETSGVTGTHQEFDMKFIILTSKLFQPWYWIIRSWVWCGQPDVRSAFSLAECAQVLLLPWIVGSPTFQFFTFSVHSVLASFSGHWSSGAQLNGEEVSWTDPFNPYKTLFGQIAKLVASRNHMAGFDLSHELFRAAYDIAFYSGVHPNFYFLILNKHWVYSRIIFFRPPEDPENENYQALTARLWPQYLVDNLFDCFEKLHFRSKYLYALC